MYNLATNLIKKTIHVVTNTKIQEKIADGYCDTNLQVEDKEIIQVTRSARAQTVMEDLQRRRRHAK